MPEKDMGLNEWADMFREIYYPTQNYERSRYQIYARLVKNLAGGSHSMLRTRDAAAARVFIGKLYAWFCALAVAVNEHDLQEVVWAKYPAVCPRCRTTPCSCEAGPPAPIDYQALRDLEVENVRQRPRNVRDWQVMFATIYPGAIDRDGSERNWRTLSLIMTRVAEELGEAGEALCLDARIDSTARFALRNELADVFAWIMALANNVQLISPDAGGMWLVDQVWDMYPDACYNCNEKPCHCVRGDYRLELASVGAAAPTQFDRRTGLANSVALTRMLDRIADHDIATSASLIFFDLDHFGAVNKQHGHDVGDRVLKQRAELAADIVGDRGTVFRRGGEEFVILLPHMEHRDACEIAENLRRAFEESEFASEKGGPFKVTSSFGVASYPADVRDPSGLERAADERARDAKQQGRNRVVGRR